MTLASPQILRSGYLHYTQIDTYTLRAWCDGADVAGVFARASAAEPARTRSAAHTPSCRRTTPPALPSGTVHEEMQCYFLRTEAYRLIIKKSL